MALAPDVPYNIGDPAFGGYVAGIIDTTRGNIIAADASQVGQRYVLIVGPKALETSIQWKTSQSAAPAASRTRWDGLSATLAMNSATYPAAQYCAGLSHPADRASAWYLPAMDELELIYRNLKSTTESNYVYTRTGSDFPGTAQDVGYNPSSDPAGAAYTSTNPARTAVAAFRDGGGQDLGDSGTNVYFWTSTEYSSSYAWIQYASGSVAGNQSYNTKAASSSVRPVRRILVSDLNYPPNAPTWTTPDNQAVAADEANTLTWAFNDPDAGDTQSAYNLKRWTLDANGSRVGAAVTTYAATPLSQHTIPAGTLTAGTKYEFQVDTFDSKGVEGPYSASLFLTAGTRPSAPTWLDPINGQTIGLSSYTGTISAPNVDASEWTLYADNAGSIDTSTVLAGPVTKTTGDLRSHTWTGLANNTTVWWSVRIKDDGLWSQPAQIRTPVSYTPPAEPTATLSTDPNTGALLVAITNPVSGAGEPGVTHNIVKADDGDGKGFTTRFGSSMVTPNTTWTYWLAKGARDYSGNIQVTAVGDNGTTSTVTIT